MVPMKAWHPWGYWHLTRRIPCESCSWDKARAGIPHFREETTWKYVKCQPPCFLLWPFYEHVQVFFVEITLICQVILYSHWAFPLLKIQRVQCVQPFQQLGWNCSLPGANIAVSNNENTIAISTFDHHQVLRLMGRSQHSQQWTLHLSMYQAVS